MMMRSVRQADVRGFFARVLVLSRPSRPRSSLLHLKLMVCSLLLCATHSTAGSQQDPQRGRQQARGFYPAKTRFCAVS